MSIFFGEILLQHNHEFQMNIIKLQCFCQPFDRGLAGPVSEFCCSQVDGEKNAKIQSLHVENFPIYCARFTTDGQQVVLGSRHKAFYNYDMISGALMNIQPIKGTV